MINDQAEPRPDDAAAVEQTRGMHDELGLSELKRRISEVPVNARGRRQFGSPIREQIVAYAKRRTGEGASAAMVGRELGLNPATFSSWMTGGGARAKRANKKSAVRRVEVEAKASGVDPVLKLPNGVQIEGLRLDEMVAVAKALS